MAIEELNRTNIQALWRHMPQQPFNWPRKAAVLGGNPKQTSVLDVPEGWVKPQLRRLVAPFAEAVSGTPNVGRELDVIESMLFELVKAEDLQADRFPNTYHCAHAAGSPASTSFLRRRPARTTARCGSSRGPRSTSADTWPSCRHRAALTTTRARWR